MRYNQTNKAVRLMSHYVRLCRIMSTLWMIPKSHSESLFGYVRLCWYTETTLNLVSDIHMMSGSFGKFESKSWNEQKFFGRLRVLKCIIENPPSGLFAKIRSLIHSHDTGNYYKCCKFYEYLRMCHILSIRCYIPRNACNYQLDPKLMVSIPEYLGNPQTEVPL